MSGVIETPQIMYVINVSLCILRFWDHVWDAETTSPPPLFKDLHKCINHRYISACLIIVYVGVRRSYISYSIFVPSFVLLFVRVSSGFNLSKS